MKLFLMAIVLVGLSIAGIAVKMFFIKGSSFVKTCGSVDPVTGRKIACTCGEEGNGNKMNCNNSPV